MQFVAIGWKGGGGVPILHSIETEDTPKEHTMKTIATHLTRITTIAAVAAAGFMMQAAHAAPGEVRVVQLPKVVVTAQRIRVVQLERVVVTAKRLAPANTVVAQRASRLAPV